MFYRSNTNLRVFYISAIYFDHVKYSYQTKHIIRANVVSLQDLNISSTVYVATLLSCVLSAFGFLNPLNMTFSVFFLPLPSSLLSSYSEEEIFMYWNDKSYNHVATKTIWFFLTIIFKSCSSSSVSLYFSGSSTLFHLAAFSRIFFASRIRPLATNQGIDSDINLWEKKEENQEMVLPFLYYLSHVNTTL